MNPEEAVAEIKRIIAKDFGLEEDQYTIEDLKEVEPIFCTTEMSNVPRYEFQLNIQGLQINYFVLCSPIDGYLDNKRLWVRNYNYNIPRVIMKQFLKSAVKNAKQVAELTEKIASLEAENEALRLLPGAPEYFAAKKHYESMKE